ncbi:MAG TPA: hydroxyethylthiazole kinase [Candidatus Margulisiibacteriota bacterium]|nr:hydroxyethylthiazole kinase [Candidatus Margulisiibacteriota bacterium]
MKRIELDAGKLLERVRQNKPVVHHLTNWVTIYDCANIIKALGGSPVMAHAKEEVAEMAGIASSLVLNIGTLTVDFVEAMKIAAKSANKKGIPVLLDVCGAGATGLRDDKCFELLDEARIDIIKGNSSEIARVAGEKVRTKGVDASSLNLNLQKIARDLSSKRKCTVVITGETDIVADEKRLYLVKNGDKMLSSVVGTGCMVSSVIGVFAAVERDLLYSAAAGLVCFEVAAECAAKESVGPASFKERLFDFIFRIDKQTVNRMQKIEG